MIRLVDLLSDIAGSMGYYYTSSSSNDIDSDTTNLPRLKRWKRLINDAYLAICHMMPEEFLIKEKAEFIAGAYTTGTVVLSQFAQSPTGTGTTWTRKMQMRQFLPDGTYRPYFIKSFTSTTSITLVQGYMDTALAAASYTIANWAIPLPNDYLAPVDKDSFFDADRNVPIPLLDVARFRNAYPINYQTGTPRVCCIDGVSPASRITDTGDVIKDSVSISFDNYTTTAYEDNNRMLRIEGDSILYKLVSLAGGSGVVSPAVQRADGTAIDFDIDPAPVPLLWFDSAPASDFQLLMRYYAKPEILWTDEQRCALAGDYELAFKKLAAYNVISAYSGDRLLKTEALAAVTTAMALLPKHIDTTPILKEVNRDARRRHGITFPNVGIAT